MKMNKRVVKRLRNLEELVRVLLIIILVLIIGLWAAIIHPDVEEKNETNIKAVETVNQN